MKVTIDEVPVYFPHPEIHPEQLRYMHYLKTVLDRKSHGILQMPKNKGKSSALISFITSYRLWKPENLQMKLIYCARNLEETENILSELKTIYQLQRHFLGDAANMLAIGFATRMNKLCINSTITEFSISDEFVDSKCLGCTASWIRELALHNTNINICSYFEKYQVDRPVLPPGVYTIEDLHELGEDEQNDFCPYFVAIDALRTANVVVICGYNYLLNPKYAGIISSKLMDESIVVLDDAEDILEVCKTSLSVAVSMHTLTSTSLFVKEMRLQLESFNANDPDRLRAEYDRLLQGLTRNGDDLPPSDVWRAHPALPADVLVQPMPEDIRSASNFLTALQHLIGYLKPMLSCEDVQDERSLLILVERLQPHLNLQSLRLFYERFHSLISTLKVKNPAHLHCSDARVLCDFATMLGIYAQSSEFRIRRGPRGMLEHAPDVLCQYALQICCDDPSLAMKVVLDRFQSVVITATTGTSDSLGRFPQILKFQPIVCRPVSSDDP